MSKKGKRLSTGFALKSAVLLPENDDDDERQEEEQKAERAKQGEKNLSPAQRRTRVPGVAVELDKIDAPAGQKGPGAAPGGMTVPKKALNTAQLSELYTNILNMANRNVLPRSDLLSCGPSWDIDSS